MNWTTFTLAALLTLAAAPASAITTDHAHLPPPDLNMNATWPATLNEAPATQLQLGSLRIRFGKTTLKHIRANVGAGRIDHQGDAGDSLTWLCYTVPKGAGATRFWLVSGELDGGKYVTGIIARHASTAPVATPACPVLPQQFRHAALDHGVWIGMSVAALANIVGRPSHQTADWRMFDYSKTFKTPACVEADRSSSLWVRSTDDHISEIEAFQTISC